MTTELIQKAVILNDKGEMLMVRRSKTDIRRPLQWDLPGGLREKDEELIASVQREILEETGLSVNDPKPIFSKTEVRKWKDKDSEQIQNVVFVFYIGKTKSKDVTISHEHSEFQWKPIAEATRDFEYPLQREVLRYIVNNDLVKDALSS